MMDFLFLLNIKLFSTQAIYITYLYYQLNQESYNITKDSFYLNILSLKL